jgi:hypothetical protein
MELVVPAGRRVGRFSLLHRRVRNDAKDGDED